MLHLSLGRRNAGGEVRAPSNATHDRGSVLLEGGSTRARFTAPLTVQLSPGFLTQSRRAGGARQTKPDFLVRLQEEPDQATELLETELGAGDSRVWSQL